MSLRLYAIVRGGARLGALGRGAAREALTSVKAGGARVVVGEAPPADLAEPSPDEIRAHDRAVRRVAKKTGAVLPFRYGSATADAEALRALLDPMAPAIARALDDVDGCVQYTLRVYGKPAPAPRSAAAPATAKAGAAKTGAAKAGAAKAGPGALWLEERARRARVPEIAEVTEATAALVRDVRVERHDRPPLLASVYHLVPSSSSRSYRAALRRSAGALAPDRVRVRATGPWPPYAFAELP